MEPTTRFDVNTAMEEWLLALRRKRCCRRDDLEELRSHLLDLIDDLTTGGLTSEQAFRAAIQQLGDADALAGEFGKVNRWYVWRQKTLATGKVAVTSKRVAAFSLIFVAITFGSIFGQKPSDKRRKNPSKPPAEKIFPSKDTLQPSSRNSLLPFQPVA